MRAPRDAAGKSSRVADRGEKRAAEQVAGFEIMEEKPPAGLVRRYFITQHHLTGLFMGGLLVFVQERVRDKSKPRPPFFWLLRAWVALCVRPFIKKELRGLAFPGQLRRRLEMLGPTYIKLGQVLSLREDILPRSVTDELKNLLTRLPIVPFHRYLELLATGLGRPVSTVFAQIDEVPVGSASIAQTHRATTLTGEKVIIKVVKPGIKKILGRDAILMSALGSILQMLIPRYQPKKVLHEFSRYTAREVDLRLEADNAETFSAHFKDEKDVRFPRIYRELSSESVLCMEFFDGLRPDAEEAQVLTSREREYLLETGAGVIIRMLYRDGFFHADLHPGNLLILDRRQCGFIDLGMVGRFDDELRRTLLYYYYCLVIGDAENAARYLGSVAKTTTKSRPDEFRKAVADISRRWHRSATFDDFSLGQLIMESVSMGGRYHMYFPMEMVLMVKALVTFEGVGQILSPGFDVAALSKKHITQLFFNQFNPVSLFKQSLRGAPEVVDAMVKAPLLVTQGLRFLEESTKRKPENPLTGIRGTMFAGFNVLAGALILAFRGADWPLSLPFFVVALFLVIRRPR